MSISKGVAGIGRRILIVFGGAMCVSLGACQSTQDRVHLLEQENVELRDRAEDLEFALDQSEGQRRQLEQQIAGLRRERDDLQQRAATPPAAATGFEGIRGVTSQTLASGEVVLDVAGDVLFDSGQVTLKADARRTLDSIAQVLQSRYAGRMIRIEGHTDTDPIRRSQWKTNERLSAERALAVEEYLATKGIPNRRMYIAAFGPAFPKSTKQASRRVEIMVLNAPAP